MTMPVLELQKIVGVEHVLINDSDKDYASLDRSNGLLKSLPLLVVRVFSQTELIDCVRLCLSRKNPLLIRAAGTGKSGGAIASPTTIVIDVTGLNRIISIDTDNLLAVVEPGVILAHLKNAAMHQGLFYPPDPASQDYCTIGGNVAENAAGPSTIKYGTTRDYLLGGTAIIGTGEMIDFGKQTPKGVCGFDIASLLCGSEGTLAVFTKLTLRLLPYPKSIAACIVYFNDEESALYAVNYLQNRGHRPKTLEYIDAICLKALEKHSKTTLATAQSALMIECDAGFDDGARQEIDAILHTLTPLSPTSYTKATTKAELKKLWHERSLLSEACTHYMGYKLSEDIAVPLGKLVMLMRAVKEMSKPPHLMVGLFGHAGDGNLHVQIMFDKAELAAAAQELCHELLIVVVRLGGTIAAEHGIGLKKKAYLPLEQSATLIDVQKRIKKAFDPHNLLNPGKIFDV
jgi:glycolate oxidase